MLDSLRSFSGGLGAKLLLGFLILTFGIWGIGDMVHSPAGKLVIATVGSETITADDYIRALRRKGDEIHRMMGDNFSINILKDQRLAHHVLLQMVDHSLLRQESEALGLIPSDADIVRRIRNNPGFQDKKGNFDRVIFEAMLKDTGLSEKMFTGQLRQDMATNLLVETLIQAAPVSDIAAHTLYDAREESRNITLYALKPSLVSDVPAPGEAQIKAFYDTHPREFTAPEYRTVSYVTLGPSDVEKNGKPADADLQAAYQERIDEFRHPERRTVEQLLYSSQDKVNQAADMLAHGKTIDQVAKETDIINKGSVSLGKVERANIMEAAADAVFALKSGEHTAPVQSPFGWHIFHVSAIEPPSVASFEEVRTTLEKDMNLHGFDNALHALANKLQDSLAGGSTLAEVAKEFGLKMVSVGPFDHDGKTSDGTKDAIPDLDKFVEVAFKTDEKTESMLTQGKSGLFYIVHVDKLAPERLRPLEEMKATATTLWQAGERQAKLEALAGEIGEKFENPAERGAVIGKYNLQPVATAPIKHNSRSAGSIRLPPALIVDVFSRKLLSGTRAYPAQNGDYLLAVVDSAIPAPAPDKDPKLIAIAADIRQGLHVQQQNELLGQYTQMLQHKYPVAIHEDALQAVLK